MAELFPFYCETCMQYLDFSTNLEFQTKHAKACLKKQHSELQKDRRSSACVVLQDFEVF